MASIGDIYGVEILRRYGFPVGWIGTWPINSARELRTVGQVEYDYQNDMPAFSASGTLSNYGIDWPHDPDVGAMTGSWDFTSDRSIGVDIGADASLPDWRWIGNAKAGLKCSFARARGLVLAIGASQNQRLKDLDGLRAQLLAAAHGGRMKPGHAVVIEREYASNGILIASEGGTGNVTATTNLDVGPGGHTLASFAADFKLHTQSGHATYTSLPNGFTVAYRVAVLGTRGWWWWKRIVVMGHTRLSAAEREAMLSREDYFAPFDGAWFD